jgi:hypothetical protein
MSYIILAISLVVSFGVGVAFGSSTGFAAGMKHAINHYYAQIDNNARLYTTLLDLGEDGVLVLKLTKRGGE